MLHSYRQTEECYFLSAVYIAGKRRANQLQDENKWQLLDTTELGHLRDPKQLTSRQKWFPK
jgi:hypothetical protein